MKITCKQFEELLPFYLNDELSDTLKAAFIEHLHNCPNCHIKFNMLNSIVNDLKDAYNQLMFEPQKSDIVIEPEQSEENDNMSNLSAYIDNELNDDINIQIRRDIVTKPTLRKKIEQLYSVRKLLTDSFNNEKNKLKNDFAKEIMKKIHSNPQQKDNYSPCLIFICFVISMVIISFLIIKSVI